MCEPASLFRKINTCRKLHAQVEGWEKLSPNSMKSSLEALCFVSVLPFGPREVKTIPPHIILLVSLWLQFGFPMVSYRFHLTFLVIFSIRSSFSLCRSWISVFHPMPCVPKTSSQIAAMPRICFDTKQGQAEKTTTYP